MLETIGVSSIDQLIDETVPKSIRLKAPLKLPEGVTEFEFLEYTKETGAKNKLFHNFIGQGYYGTITPSVIKRTYWKIQVGILHTLLIKPRYHKGDWKAF